MSCSQNTITPRRPIGTDYRLDCITLLYTRTRQVRAAHIFTTQASYPSGVHTPGSRRRIAQFLSVPAITPTANEGLDRVVRDYPPPRRRGR